MKSRQKKETMEWTPNQKKEESAVKRSKFHIESMHEMKEDPENGHQIKRRKNL